MEIQQVKSVCIKKTNRLGGGGEIPVYSEKSYQIHKHDCLLSADVKLMNICLGGRSGLLSVLVDTVKIFSASGASWARFTGEIAHCEGIFQFRFV